MSSSPPNEDYKSKIVANPLQIPKYSWETETQCDEFTQEIPTYSWEADSSFKPNVLRPKYDKQAQCPDQKRVLEDVQPSQLIDKADSYGESTSKECKDHYYDYEFAQRPESPNLNIDVDAIKRELCDGYLDSPPKKQKGKKKFWF